MRVLAGALFVVMFSSPARASGPDLSSLEATFHQIIRTFPGQVGAAVVHLESGAVLKIRGDERFPMASVCKLPIAIELLWQVAERTLQLD